MRVLIFGNVNIDQFHYYYGAFGVGSSRQKISANAKFGLENKIKLKK